MAFDYPGQSFTFAGQSPWRPGAAMIQVIIANGGAAKSGV
jgi:hypothetical protein